MSTTVVLYPAGTDFKMDYYKSTHMPLVQKHWAQYGLKSWKVLQFPPDAPYTVGAVLEWDKIEDFQTAATSAEAKEVLGDIPNFSNKDPVLMPSHVVLKS